MHWHIYYFDKVSGEHSFMDVIVHYPTDKQDLELLHKKVAIEHAKFVVDYISKLNCSENKKLELLGKISTQ